MVERYRQDEVSLFVAQKDHAIFDLPWKFSRSSAAENSPLDARVLLEDVAASPQQKELLDRLVGYGFARSDAQSVTVERFEKANPLRPVLTRRHVALCKTYHPALEKMPWRLTGALKHPEGLADQAVVLDFSHLPIAAPDVAGSARKAYAEGVLDKKGRVFYCKYPETAALLAATAGGLPFYDVTRRGRG